MCHGQASLDLHCSPGILPLRAAGELGEHSENPAATSQTLVALQPDPRLGVPCPAPGNLAVVA